MTDIETLMREFEPPAESTRHLEECLRLIARGRSRSKTRRWVQWGMAAALGGSLLLNGYMVNLQSREPAGATPMAPVLEVASYYPETQRYEQTIEFE